jgi:MFS family permease
MEEGSLAQRQFLIRAGIIVGSGGLIFGYDIGVISGTLSRITDTFDLASYEVGLVVAILYVGSILGSILGGPLCDYLGRWRTIHIQNFLFILGSFLTGLATNLTTLCIGRFVVGIASAVSGIADVPYLNEISPPQYRGVLSSQYEIAVSVGVLVSFAIALALSGLEYGWRVAFLLPSAAALLQSLGMFLLPESPRWLVEKGKLDKANVALCSIYGDAYLIHCANRDRENEEVPQEVREYLRAVDRTSKLTALSSAVGAVDESAHGTSTESSESALNPKAAPQQSHSVSSLQGSTALRALFQKEQHVLQQYQYPIYLIIVVQVLAQVTGGNVIRNYAPTIFEDGGVSNTMSLLFNLLFGVVKTIFTFVSIAYIDTTGRLTLLVYGIVLVAGGMLFLAICSLTSASGNISNVPAFVVGCALVYAGFGLGYGPVPWVLSAEMFPTLIRGRIMSLSLLASNVAQLVVNFLFLPMTEGLTTSGTFFLFVALNILTFFFAKKFLVETKEIAPDEILASLLDRYDHSASKLITRWPAVLGPLVTFCCCATGLQESASQPLPTHSTGHDAGIRSASPSAPLESSSPTGTSRKGYHSTAEGKVSSGSAGSTVNPLIGERAHSGVGSSSSKLVLSSVGAGSGVK